MIIAIAYNLMTNTDDELQAEYDTPETINFLSDNINRLGHTSVPLELSRPLSMVLKDIRRIRPDLIFNISEGNRGKMREAFWPVIFEELGIPFTGSDGHTMSINLDKNLTKQLVESAGVNVPRGFFWDGYSDYKSNDLKFPLIVKPNFEGSSKGIYQSNVVENELDLEDRLKYLIKDYPSGLIVEEFIEGREVTVPFLYGMELDPIEVKINSAAFRGKKYNIYDYEIKRYLDKDHVSSDFARFPAQVTEKIKQQAGQVVQATNCKDFGRVDFRVTTKGEPYFLEINCLPAIGPDEFIFFAAAQLGVSVEGVFEKIIESATVRFPHLKNIKVRRRNIHLKETVSESVSVLAEEPVYSTSVQT